MAALNDHFKRHIKQKSVLGKIIIHYYIVMNTLIIENKYKIIIFKNMTADEENKYNNIQTCCLQHIDNAPNKFKFNQNKISNEVQHM